MFSFRALCSYFKGNTGNETRNETQDEIYMICFVSLLLLFIKHLCLYFIDKLYIPNEIRFLNPNLI